MQKPSITLRAFGAIAHQTFSFPNDHMPTLPTTLARCSRAAIALAGLLILTGCEKLNFWRMDGHQSTIVVDGPVAREQLSLFIITCWVSLVIFIVVGAVLAYATFKFRARSEDDEHAEPPPQGHGNPFVELGLIGASVLWPAFNFVGDQRQFAACRGNLGSVFRTPIPALVPGCVPSIRLTDSALGLIGVSIPASFGLSSKGWQEIFGSHRIVGFLLSEFGPTQWTKFGLLGGFTRHTSCC